MKKTKPRPPGVQPDPHMHIKAIADQLRAAPKPGARDARTVPEVEALMNAAMDAVRKAAPTSFEHLGRTYWLRCTLCALVEVFDSPAALHPMVESMAFSTRAAGHKPGQH